MTTHAFNDEDALPTQENAFSARGEAPRRGGSAAGGSSKSGAIGKMIVVAVGVVLIVGGVGLVYLKNARPAQTVVSAPSPEVYPNDAPASGALAGEEELLFASSVDGPAAAGLEAAPAAAPAFTAPQAMSMTPPDVARVDPVMAEAMQQATIEAAEASLPPQSPGDAPTSSAPPASSPNTDALLQRIAVLEASLGRLTAEVDTLDKDLNLVESQMPALRAQVRQTTPPRAVPRSTAPPARPAAPVPAVAAAAATPQGFKLKAVLDGQAWIEGRDGQTYTVRSGDNIDGLGVVVEIDAVRNEVRFPAGVTLNFR